MQHTCNFYGLPHMVFIRNAMGSPMVFSWNAMGTPPWSDIQLPQAPPEVFHASIIETTSIPHITEQLSYHITHNGPTLVPSTHGYSAETYLALQKLNKRIPSCCPDDFLN